MNAASTRSIFDKVKLNGFELNNSIVMAPMTRSRAIGIVPNELMVEYYAQRASAGLIITEGTSPSADGLGYARTPGIFDQRQIDGWKQVTDAVHRKGGRIFLQLMHVGRISHPANIPPGGRILAPSSIAAAGTMWTDSAGMQLHGSPAQMTQEDINRTIKEFARGAENAIKAGFDGVELHGANGYLLEQFLNPNSNQRNDEYGGEPPARARFVVEVTRAVADVIGKNKVGVRLSPYNTFNDMPLYDSINETYLHLVRELATLDIAYLHLIDASARKTTQGLELIRGIRNQFENILILNGGYNRERADAALLNDGADLISFGSPFIANPDLPHRLRNDIPLAKPDGSTFYTADAKGYTDYTLA
jgi:N-ethylmaleimide reductase